MSDIALTGSDIHSFGMSDIFTFGKCFGTCGRHYVKVSCNFLFDEKGRFSVGDDAHGVPLTGPCEALITELNYKIVQIETDLQKLHRY